MPNDNIVQTDQRAESLDNENVNQGASNLGDPSLAEQSAENAGGGDEATDPDFFDNAPSEPDPDDGYWTVGFDGPFKVRTRLEEGDKEIDVDDRQAMLEGQVIMREFEGVPLIAKDVSITLNFDFTAQNIKLDGKFKGPIELTGASGDEPLVIKPDAHFEFRLPVQTGAFTSKDMSANSAVPGRKLVDTAIRYTLVPEVDIRTTEDVGAMMRFEVARD